MVGDQPAGNERPLDLDGVDLLRLEEALLDIFDSETLGTIGYYALNKSRDEFSNEDASRPEVVRDLVATAREDERLRELLATINELATNLKTTKGDALVALSAELLQRPPRPAGVLPPTRRSDPLDDTNVDLCRTHGTSRDTRLDPTSHTMIPFEITAERAQEICRAWFGSEFAHPRDLKTKAKLAAPIGVYVSAWRWSGHAISTWSARAVYFERRERTIRTAAPRNAAPGAAPPPETTEVEVIRHPPVEVSGDHEESYPDLWVLAFAKPTWLSSVWPTPTGYDLGQLAPYDRERAANYRVEPPTSDRQTSRLSACQQITSAEEAACQALMPGDEVQDPAIKTRVVSLEDALIDFPIWRVSYDYGGKPYQCHVNGQSGAAVCDGPIDAARSLLPIFIIIVVILGIALVGYLGGGR